MKRPAAGMAHGEVHLKRYTQANEPTSLSPMKKALSIAPYSCATRTSSFEGNATGNFNHIVIP